MVELAKQRGLNHDARVRQQLADLYTKTRIQRFLSMRTLTAASQGKVPGPEGSVGKLFGARIITQTGDLAITLAGPGAVAGDTHAASRHAERAREPHRRRVRRGDEEHPRRAGARPPRRAPTRQGRRLERRASVGLCRPRCSAGYPPRRRSGLRRVLQLRLRTARVKPLALPARRDTRLADARDSGECSSSASAPHASNRCRSLLGGIPASPTLGTPASAPAPPPHRTRQTVAALAARELSRRDRKAWHARCDNAWTWTTSRRRRIRSPSWPPSPCCSAPITASGAAPFAPHHRRHTPSSHRVPRRAPTRPSAGRCVCVRVTTTTVRRTTTTDEAFVDDHGRLARDGDDGCACDSHVHRRDNDDHRRPDDDHDHAADRPRPRRIRRPRPRR